MSRLFDVETAFRWCRCGSRSDNDELGAKKKKSRRQYVCRCRLVIPKNKGGGGGEEKKKKGDGELERAGVGEDE